MTELTPEALAILAGGDPTAKKAGVVQTVGAIVGLTVIALAGGGALGYLLGQAPAAPVEAPAAPEAGAKATVSAAIDGGPTDIVLPLEPVLTDISSPPGTQIRMEASVLLRMAADADADQSVLASQLQADMLVFLRTLELAQVEGSRGLLHLREDLLERARLRSPAVADIVVRSLVVK